MTVFLFIIGCLTTYRLTVLIARDVGPFDVFKRLRQVARFTKLLSCPFCVSIWAAALVCLGFYFVGIHAHAIIWACYILSMSAVAIALDRTFTVDFQG